ncbi:MAG: hypothetical protein ACYDBJ_07155 [Aggregatilineales bacterium]
MAKRSLLPPSTDAQKREVSVNLRFNAEVYERLKTLAEFSGTGVANLLFYVTVNTTLPMMEKEMNKAKQNPTTSIERPPAPKLPAELPQRPVQE